MSNASHRRGRGTRTFCWPREAGNMLVQPLELLADARRAHPLSRRSDRTPAGSTKREEYPYP